ncbi:serine/threonine-protein kinase M1 [Candidozyma auris]
MATAIDGLLYDQEKPRECCYFLEEIPMELIALTSSECDSYERTILYLENCYRDGKVQNNNRLDYLSITSTLQSVYSNIDDYDALDGVLKKFSTNNLAEKLDTFQYNENWAIAQESFEVLSHIGSEDDRVDCNTKLLKSLTNHGLYDSVIQRLNLNARELTQLPLPWVMTGLEAATATSNVKELRKWLTLANTIGKSSDVEDLFHAKFATALLALNSNDLDRFNSCVEEIYALLGQSLSSSRSSSLSRNSTFLLQLHILYDTSTIVLNKDDSSRLTEIERVFKERMSNTDLSFDTQWRILSIHKAALCIE